jgi:hypothetical protein
MLLGGAEMDDRSKKPLERVPVPKSTDEWQDMKDLEFEPEVLDDSLEQAIGDEPAKEPGRKKLKAGKPEIATDELEQAAGDVPLKIPRRR